MSTPESSTPGKLSATEEQFLKDMGISESRYREILEQSHWHGIHTRYLSGESPEQIAQSYPHITAKQISNKAAHYKWTEQRVRIRESVENSVEAELIDLTQLLFAAAKKVLNNFIADKYIGPEECKVLVTVMRLAWPKVAIMPQYHESTMILPAPIAAHASNGNGNGNGNRMPLKC